MIQDANELQREESPEQNNQLDISREEEIKGQDAVVSIVEHRAATEEDMKKAEEEKDLIVVDSDVK